VIEPLLEAERAMDFGMFDRAERLYRSVADGDPKNSIAVVGLARVALERGDDDEALRLAGRAVAIDPENPAARRLVFRLEEIRAARGEAAAARGEAAAARGDGAGVRDEGDAAKADDGADGDAARGEGDAAKADDGADATRPAELTRSPSPAKPERTTRRRSRGSLLTRLLRRR